MQWNRVRRGCCALVLGALTTWTAGRTLAAPHPELEKKINDLTESLKSAKPAAESATVQPLIDAHLQLSQMLLADRDFTGALQNLRKARGIAVTRLKGRQATDVTGQIDVQLTLAEWRERNDGRGLRAEFFQTRELTGKLADRVEPNVDFIWGNGVPDGWLDARDYACRFTGFIQAPAAGQYKLVVLHDDGCRLWLDDKMILDAWRDGFASGDVLVTLTGKPQALRVEHYRGPGGSSVSLHWRPPGASAESIIPPEFFFTDPSAATRFANKPYVLPKGYGLNAEYFAGDKFADKDKRLTRVDPSPNFFWELARPDPTVGDHFSATWSGYLRAPAPGQYVLIVQLDDWARVFFDGNRVLHPDRPGVYEATVQMTDKPVALAIKYANFGGPAYLHLRWKKVGSAAPPTIIPASAFFTDKTTADYAPPPPYR